MHLGQLSTNDSWSPRASEHGGEERVGLSSSVFEIYVREGGHVLAKIAGHTLKCYFSTKCSVLDELSRNRSRSCLGNLPIRAKSTKVRGHKGHSPSDESFHKQEILLYSVFYPVKGFGCISDYPNLDKPSASPYVTYGMFYNISLR